MLNEFQILQPEEFNVFLNCDNKNMTKQEDTLDVDLGKTFRQPFYLKDHADEGTMFDIVEQGFNLKATKYNNATHFADREAALTDLSLHPWSPQKEKLTSLPAPLQFSLGSEPSEKTEHGERVLSGLTSLKGLQTGTSNVRQPAKETSGADDRTDTTTSSPSSPSSSTASSVRKVIRKVNHKVRITPDENFSFYKGHIKPYTKEERQRVLRRYREKRSRRVFKKKVRYECRRKFAIKRPRVGGRFVKIKK